MRRSEAFLATSRDAPDAGTELVALMRRAGLIREFGSGLWGFLPTGERVRQTVTDRIERAMTDCGGQRIALPGLQYDEIWRESGRWRAFDDEMLTLENREGQAMCLAPSHEEGVVRLTDGFVRSHEDLPLLVYQTTEKYRDDHARNGLVRCKAFTMNDAYSLHTDERSLDQTYERVREASLRVFDDLGLDVAVVAAEDIVMGGSDSEEFVAPVERGSDDLLSCAAEDCRFGVTDEHERFEDYEAGGHCPDCGGRLSASEGIEVGHVFKLGTRYSEAMGLTVDAPGGETSVVMGSYGFGVTRTIQTLLQQQLGRVDDAEAAGCRWPVTDWGTVAPYQCAIVPLQYDGQYRAVADELYDALGSAERLDADAVLLFDDPDQSIGERFAESGLLGVPVTVVIGNHFDETGQVELEYADGRIETVAPEAVANRVVEYAGRRD